MGKNSQVTILIIIGILIVLISVFVGIRLLRDKSDIEKAGEHIVTVGISRDSINSFMSACVKQTALNAEHEYGLDKQISPPLIEEYLLDNLPKCFANFDIFKEQGLLVEEKGDIEVSVEITNDAMLIDFTYPLTFNKGVTEINFDQESYLLPRIVMESINFDRETRVTSADGSMILEIPAGTEVTLNNEPVNQVGIKLLDREFNSLSNSVLAGMLAFTGIPHGAKFSKPVKIIHYYEEEDIPLTIREEDIRFGYYDDYLGVWIGLPTEVDTVKNKITVETTHFSPYGTLDCDGELKKIKSDKLDKIEQKCNPCSNWEVKDGKLMTDQDIDIVTSEDVVDSWMIPEELINSEEEIEKVEVCKVDKEEDIDVIEVNEDCEEGYERRVDYTAQEVYCSKEKTIYYYETPESLKGEIQYKIEFEELGDSCIVLKAEDEFDVEKHIIIEPVCENDKCSKENIGFEETTLTFTLKAENDPYGDVNPADRKFGVVDACLNAGVTVSYKGTGDKVGSTVTCDSSKKGLKKSISGLCKVCEEVDGKFEWKTSSDCCARENYLDMRLDGCYLCDGMEWKKQSSDKLCQQYCSHDQPEKEDDIDIINKHDMATINVIKTITGRGIEEGTEEENTEYTCFENAPSEDEKKTDDSSSTGTGGVGGGVIGGGTSTGTSGGTSRTETRNEKRKEVCLEGDDEKTEYPSCPEDFEDNYKDKVIKVTEGTIDTRDLKFCDSYGNFSEDFIDLDKETELVIYGSALRKGSCMFLVEAQKELDGIKPDFYVKLNQVNDFIQSPESNKQTPSPNNLTNESQTNESIYLTWTLVPEAEFYIIYREGNIIEDVTETNYNNTNLKAGTEYVYHVTAYNSTFEIAESGFSNNVTTKTYMNTDDTPKIFDFNIIATSKVCKLTGVDSHNYFNNDHIKGTDLGSMFTYDNLMYFIFGDTNLDEPSPGSNLSNVMAITNDFDASDCINLSFGTEEIFDSKIFSDEITAIPTNGISINETIYIYFMSVKGWGTPGIWESNYGGIAYSDDNGTNFIRVDNFFAQNSNFIQVALVEKEGYLYLFGIPAGRFGGVKLAKVKTDKILNKTEYNYCKLDSGNCTWISNETDADIIIQGLVGELSVQWNKYMKKWLMTYLNEDESKIQIRHSSELWGNWSQPKTLVDCTIQEYEGCYAPFIHPVYFENENIYFTLSLWPTYNVYLMKAELEPILLN